MSQKLDAIIVGGGHNGLVCGALMARAGKSVLVLERRYLTGGAAVTEEIHPGFRTSTASYIMGLMQPKVIMELNLQKYGYEVLPTPPTVFALAGDRYFIAHGDTAKFSAEIAKLSPEDAAAYPAYRAHLDKVAPFLRQLLFETPIDPGRGSMADLRRLAGFVWRFRKVGSQFYDIYNLLTLSAWDYLSRWFKHDDVKLVLGFFAGGGGANASLKTPGTAYLLIRGLLRDGSTPAGPSGFIKGGMGAISDAIRRAGEDAGMKVRTDAEVARILTRDGRAVGVQLASGEKIEARTVIANANAQTVFNRLLAGEKISEDFKRDIDHIRCESTVFRVNLALSGLPEWRGTGRFDTGFGYPSQVTIPHSIDYMESAFHTASFGEIAPNPFLVVKLPSLVDPTLAPTGGHVMTLFGGHAPYTLRQGDWDSRRDELLGRAMTVLRGQFPDIDKHVLHAQLLTPLDFERIFDLPRGHVHHGEILPDQMFFRRPASHFADYRTPVAGLYMCGASTHPGGGVTGVPGFNSAREILADQRNWGAA